MRISLTLHPNLLALTYKSIPKESNHFDLEISNHRSVKDFIQSLGVPHAEVGCIVVNSRESDLGYILKNDDQLEVFPVPMGLSPGEVPCFVCDVHLGKLARRLRFLGFDTIFDISLDDLGLARVSQAEKRVVLSRDRGLLMRNMVKKGIFIRDANPEKQVREVLTRLDIFTLISPFSRCIVCNGILEQADMHSEFFQRRLVSQIPSAVLSWCSTFNYCLSCTRVFWKGSHYMKLLSFLHLYQIH